MLRWLTAGESHGPSLVAVLEGVPAGVEVTSTGIAAELARRRLGYGRGARMSFEQDEVEIVGGVRHGRTLGSPVAAALGVPLAVAPWTLASRACGGDDLVVSTVPKGAADHLAEADWKPGGVLFDVVYDPWPTPLAAAAARAGCRVVSGLDLLLTQGAHQFTMYTGVPAPLDAMRHALQAAAARR